MSRRIETGISTQSDVSSAGDVRRESEDLMEQLDQLTTVSTDQFDPACVARVRQFVQYEIDHPVWRKPYRFFEDIEDFKLYFLLHPEWQGKTPTEMNKDSQSGAGGFCRALYVWVRLQAGKDRQQIRTLTARIFHITTNSWSGFTNIEHWTKEFQKHPEWQGRTPKMMESDIKSGASAFYRSFCVWARRQAKDNAKVREIRRKLFSIRRREDEEHGNIEDWESEFNAHPEWQGKSAREMLNDLYSGAHQFYVAFNHWLRKTYPDDNKKRQEVRSKLFSRKQSDWSSLTTVDDWIKEFQEHPEWQGKTPGMMERDIESGAKRFYDAFSRWVRNAAKDREERGAFVRQLFPQVKTLSSKNNRRDALLEEQVALVTSKVANEVLMEFVEAKKDE